MTDLDSLRDRLSPGAVVTDADTMLGYQRDMAALVPAGQPVAVLRPAGTAEVATILAWARRTGTVVVPRGAGTGLSGGATAVDGCVVVCMERMRAIRDVDTVNRTITVEAGVVNADVGRAAAEFGLFYPPDPGSYEVSTIGGNIATNAGGMRCVKYGVTRNSVLTLEVVLADGRILHTGVPTLKNVAGLDLTQLFIGSEGILGIITAATLRLQPAPAATATFVATFPTLGAGTDALASIFEGGATPSILELMDRAAINAVEDHQRMDLDRTSALLLVGQADGPGAAVQAERIVQWCHSAGADLAMSTDDPAEGELLMRPRRMAGWALTEGAPSIVEDVAVPRSRLGELLTAIAGVGAGSTLKIATVGHAGDGNLHPTLILPDLSGPARAAAMSVAERICAIAIGLGGTITGEHGIGELKRRWLPMQLDSVALDVHRAIKTALDPGAILNPGRGF